MFERGEPIKSLDNGLQDAVHRYDNADTQLQLILDKHIDAYDEIMKAHAIKAEAHKDIKALEGAIRKLEERPFNTREGMLMFGDSATNSYGNILEYDLEDARTRARDRKEEKPLSTIREQP